MPQNTKDRWNAAHYKQLKCSLQPSIIDAFKSVCENNGLSMASVISGFMCDYSNIYLSTRVKPKQDKTTTRRLRRKKMCAVISTVTAILDVEATSLEKIPDNFRESETYAETERIVDTLESALELLKEVYGH